MIFLILLGLTFIITPLWVWTEFQSIWILTIIWLVPVGVFILYQAWKIYKHYKWKEQHLSSYELTETHVRGVSYRPEWDYGVTQEFALSDIKEVVIAPYYVRRTLNSMGRRSIELHGPIIEELAPMLIFRTETERMEILFDKHQNPKVDEWLQFIDEKGMNLTYTPYRMYWLGNKAIQPVDRDEYFNKESDRIPYEVKGGWMKDELALNDEWQRVNAGGLRTSMSIKEFEETVKKKRKWSLIIGIPVGLVVFFIGGLYLIGSML
ncbi:hypothetical protein MKY84_03450 [Chryseomicrobium sp. FSL W7-1435]|uniref:hypothetical protein n=1 Tax=Chryseomicrobium sp. FSL W7-1435 TaxID=2921704 RepID=UPI003159AE86